MLVEAVTVDAVAALHEDDGTGRVEHVLATDGAITVDGPLDALVTAGHGNACHTFLGMSY